MSNKKGKNKVCILVADDDSHIRRLISHNLSSAGYAVVEAADGTEAMELVTNDIDIALLDLQMPGATGLECLTYIKEKFPSCQAIFISAVGKVSDVVAAMNAGAFWYLSKPFNPDELLALVAKSVEVVSLQKENATLRQSVGSVLSPINIVGRSQVMQTLLEQAGKVAALDSTALITGPSGTGKSTLARHIHQLSPRAKQPFVVVSCAAVPRDLLEAELFGYERGAFTGAVSSRSGRIETADGGTLFLDEIGDMPLDLQPKLLTFLQDRTVLRIGSNEERLFDVRIIAATHQDLTKMCEERTFREDLFYRINVLSLLIPPLCERPEDIRPLAEFHLSRIAKNRGKDPYAVAEEAFSKLESYGWPGNIRELENVLERASAFSEGGAIGVEDLVFATDKMNVLGSRPSSLAGMPLSDMERLAIIATLEACGGNKTEAARQLGISQKSIYNKMERYGIAL